MENVTIEVCCDGLEHVRDAALRSAKGQETVCGMVPRRVEFCSDLSIGGITPSHEEISASTKLGIPVNVLVRPRGGNFVYSDEEFDTIAADIRFCADAGANGVVIGALDQDGKIDKVHMAPLFDLARSLGLKVTFHRAIDRNADMMAALEDVLSLGPDLILTSGGAKSAWEGRETIARMVRRCAGTGTQILAGAGVSPENARALVEATGVTQIHGSRL